MWYAWRSSQVQRAPSPALLSTDPDDWKEAYSDALKSAVEGGIILTVTEKEHLASLWRLASLCKTDKSTKYKQQLVATAESLWKSASTIHRRNELAWFRPGTREYVPGIVPIGLITLTRLRRELKEEKEREEEKVRTVRVMGGRRKKM